MLLLKRIIYPANDSLEKYVMEFNTNVLLNYSSQECFLVLKESFFSILEDGVSFIVSNTRFFSS